MKPNAKHDPKPNNTLYRLIDEDVHKGAFSRDICTRFPPEPNGYLHVGSVYAINTSYSVAKHYNGDFHLRFDDTNPLKEDIEYVNAIIEDMSWLGYCPDEHIYYGSDYAERIYEAAVTLVKQGKAYVCDLTPEEMPLYRGTLTEPGTNSPYRERSVEENLDLFLHMKHGTFPTASKVLRAKIDMSSSNINLRDPVLYRIIHAEHYRTADTWCLYPMYDFAHPIQDAIEGITHSLCSIEFKDHRPLYDWVLHQLNISEPPKQIEFGRLNLTGVVTSKRYLRQLVAGGYVEGWDDPRLPTIRGLRRRGYTPESIRNFVNDVGYIKNETTVDISLLEHHLRQELKSKVCSVMAVLHPLKVVITNYAEGETEWLSVDNNIENTSLGKRTVPFSKEIYIEREDFMENPPEDFHRLALHGEVRLKGAYFISCNKVIREEYTGEIVELHCTYDPRTKSGSGFNERKVKGTIHWVDAAHGVKAEVRLYDKLLNEESAVKEGEDWNTRIDPGSFIVESECIVEPFVTNSLELERYQFMRHGYFCLDHPSSCTEQLVFNRIVALKDSWKPKS